MIPALDSILADIIQAGNSPIGAQTVPGLRRLHARIMDFADSLAPKSQEPDDIEDFEDAINQLTETADRIDEACDAHEIGDDEEFCEEALESAGEALVDLAKVLRELEPVAQYIETTTEIVTARWASELARLGYLPPEQCRSALDALLHQARTPKESATLLALAKSILANASR